MQRRDFLIGASASLALAACGGKSLPPLPPGSLSGPNEALGHRLRQRDFPPPGETRRVGVAIAGGGIGGLSAGWRLARTGMDDFLLLEMEAESGGNSRAGRNEVSAYPLGAHYLPLPPREALAVRELLRELKVLRGADEYDERYVCQAPQERLYRNGYWEPGLLPTLGVAAAERDQYRRFHEFIDGLRQTRDVAGRRPFALPMELSTRSRKWLDVDRGNFRDWLLARGYTAPGLHWLADYACRDDYGCRAADTSAWAGLHYFACRDADGTVLTAPEGNAWLAVGLRRRYEHRILSQALVYRVEEGRREVICDVYLAAEQRSIRLLARELIWAAPLFLIPHVFVAPRAEWLAAARATDYAPWIVANLTLSQPPHTRAGTPLAWDNVIHDSDSLGYTVATHQQLRYAPGPTVITWYRALHDERAMPTTPTTPAPPRQRRVLQSREAWAEEVLADLARPHPEIRDLVTRLDIHRHAHAMIRPRPGSLWHGRREALLNAPGRIRFAHADVSGLSLFEEANYRGVAAAEQILRRLGLRESSLLG